MSDTCHGALVSYYVERIQYHPPHQMSGGGYTPAHVTVSLQAMLRGNATGKTLTYYQKDLPRTVEELLGKEEIYIENEKLVSDFNAEMEKYKNECGKTGEQFLARGRGHTSGDRWQRGEVSLEKEGQPSKVVMDDGEEQGEAQGMATLRFWSNKHIKDDDDDAIAEGEKMTMLPAHPIII